MAEVEWHKYGGEKNEQDITDLLLKIRKASWPDYQRIKYVCYLAALSEAERLGVAHSPGANGKKIVKLNK